MNYLFLSNTMLFRGATVKDIEAMLNCLKASVKTYKRGEIIYDVGEYTRCMGMVLEGAVNIENTDFWGNVSLLSRVEPGGIFGETYACVPGMPLMVSVTAEKNTTVLFMNMSNLITTCPKSCDHHNRIIGNLLAISARKSLALSSRIRHTTPKSIRGRLLSYFSERAMEEGSSTFTIPFNRQQMADYLNVDRSTMCNELSKMKKEGLITYNKNLFVLHKSEVDLYE